MFALIIFGSGCSIEIIQSLEIEQIEPYICYVGDQLPFYKVTFDKNSNILEKTINE